eukprot:500400-Pyramimonas_sp.AAC.1
MRRVCLDGGSGARPRRGPARATCWALRLQRLVRLYIGAAPPLEARPALARGGGIGRRRRWPLPGRRGRRDDL